MYKFALFCLFKRKCMIFETAAETAEAEGTTTNTETTQPI